jgi:predicted methyltransferase
MTKESHSKFEIEKHQAEYRKVGRMLSEHKKYCEYCKGVGICLDSERLILTLEGLAEWMERDPMPRTYIRR